MQSLISVAAVDWGDVPTWISALATIAAFLAALLAVRASWNVLTLERAREDRAEAQELERQRAAERAEQADHIAAWSYWAEPQMLRRTGWGALVVNESGLPIYDVTAAFFGPDGSHRGDGSQSVVPPGQNFIPWPGGLTREGGDGASREQGSDFRVAVAFRDAAGRTWHRDQNGVLTKTGVVVFPPSSRANADARPPEVTGN